MVRRLLLLALLLALSAPAGAQDAYRKALDTYREAIDRPPLVRRLTGMRVLAGTGDLRAIQVLAARYAKPRVPKDHERYLLARIIGDFFDRAEHVGPLSDFLKRHRKDPDGWLWLRCLRGAVHQPDVAPLLERVAAGRENPFVRAGTLEALAMVPRPEALVMIPNLLGKGLPKKGMPRTLLAESAAAVLLAHREARGTPEFQAAATAIIGLLARDDVADRTKLVLARHLARTFGVSKAPLDAGWWAKVLAREATGEPEETKSVAYPRFMGLTATGRRVVYLVDLSDSMLDPLTEEELALARRVPLDGGADFPWEAVKNRFDFAREHLRRSLRALDPGTRFAIVGFGDEAEPFRTTKGLVPASKRNVGLAIRELDSIEAKPDTSGKKRPHGVLRGSTNIHGALLRAFRITSRGMVDENEHVDARTFADGADTIFLLSDGKPTRDDFMALDMAEPGRTTTDAETGESRYEGYRRTLNFFGPYRMSENLLADLRRLNLFRKAEIHTISMGDADLFLMHRIAMRGLGRYRNLGGNGVLALNGSSALEVRLPEKPETFTIECWAKGPKPRQFDTVLLSAGSLGASLIWTGEGFPRPGALLRAGEETVRIVAGKSWRWRRWSHLALTYDGKSLRLFVNGRLEGRKDVAKPESAGDALLVGADADEKGLPRHQFRGAIDEVRVSKGGRYEKSFTPPRTLRKESGTLLLLRFDGDGETPWSDSSPAGRSVKTYGNPRVRSEKR